MTALQFELGSVVTTFEQRHFALELTLCQRYCYIWFGGAAGVQGASGAYFVVPYPVNMRILAAAVFNIYGTLVDGSTTYSTSSGVLNSSYSSSSILTVAISGGTAGRSVVANGSWNIVFSGEF
jgi:hypothetical protein